MSATKAVCKVEKEAVYKMITDLEGPRHPIDNMDSLNAASEYISSKLESYGFDVEIQEFTVDGMDETFKNVIGYIGDKNKEALLLGSHYDTVRNTPGANDNLSGVAVSLEVARVLGKMENPPSVIISAFTLEEGHPGINKAIQGKLTEAGYVDYKNRQSTAELQRFHKIVMKERVKRTRRGVEYLDAFYSIREDLKETMSVVEADYLDIMIGVLEEFKSRSKTGKLHYCMGSYEFVQRLKDNEIKIKEVIVLDCLGWIRDEANSQQPLPLDSRINDLVKTYKVKLEEGVGNFISVIGEKNSSGILSRLLKSFEEEVHDIPYVGLGIPLDYPIIKKMAPDVLRSDHGAFWEAGIPGIFVTDMAGFRSELYHNGGDTSDKIDYDMLEKISNAIIDTIIDY